MPFDDLRQRRKLWISRARAAHVFERERQVCEIARLAVAIPEARKNAEHLDVSLYADEIEPAQELLFAAATGPAALQELRAIAAHPALDAIARPRYVAIFQHRDEVIAHGPRQRVLEIDDARVLLASHHQIARVIVPVNEHNRLCQCLDNEKLERGRDDSLLFVGKR